MAKDRTLQAIQSAVESGTLKAGASQLLNSYTPMPQVEEIQITGNTGDVDEKILKRCILLDGLTENKTLKVKVKPYIDNEKYIMLNADHLLVVANGQGHEGVDEVRVDDVDSIQYIEANFNEESGRMGLVYLVNEQQEHIDGLQYSARNAYVNPIVETQADVNYITLPFEVFVEIPDGYSIKGWYLNDIEDENLISTDNKARIENVPTVLILDITKNNPNKP